jgi:hypothetical protein
MLRVALDPSSSFFIRFFPSVVFVSALHDFAPSIIFISAGFDAADGDENNYGMYDNPISALQQQRSFSIVGRISPQLTSSGLQVQTPAIARFTPDICSALQAPST